MVGLCASGPLAQLVAHLHDAQGVRGSSPLRPTDPTCWYAAKYALARFC